MLSVEGNDVQSRGPCSRGGVNKIFVVTASIFRMSSKTISSIDSLRHQASISTKTHGLIRPSHSLVCRSPIVIFISLKHVRIFWDVWLCTRSTYASLRMFLIPELLCNSFWVRAECWDLASPCSTGWESTTGGSQCQAFTWAWSLVLVKGVCVNARLRG